MARRSQNMRRSKNTVLTVAAVSTLVLSGSIFVLTKAWQRWDINDAWAQKTVADAKELWTALGEYKDANGEFPESIEELGMQIKNPTDFADPLATGKWHYRRLSKSDYQLYATGKAFVSSFDALVFRYSGAYPPHWFRAFDASHSKSFGAWRYITGFSQFENDP